MRNKVIFLVDRKELGIQSLKEYRSFASETESVQATENTDILISKLKSDDQDNTLIVTSIQKLSNISEDMEGLKDVDLKKIRSKRLVIIIDECHRSTFGDMLTTIKDTFKHSIIFGSPGHRYRMLISRRIARPQLYSEVKSIDIRLRMAFEIRMSLALILIWSRYMKMMNFARR